MRARGVGVATTAIALSTVMAAPAFAAHDVTPPVVTASVYASFVVGSTISAADYTDEDSIEAQTTTDIAQRLDYTFTDNSGRICGYTIYEVSDEGQSYPQEGTPLFEDDSVGATPFSATYTATNNDYDGQLGDGEDSTVGWVVGATDCNGNSSAVHIYSRPTVYQENGFNWDGGNATGTVSSTGSWGTVSCACASGRTMTMTTAKGASISYTDTYDEDGEHMAIVMAKGPGRGSAAVYVDGVKKATVNTHASANTNRIVVFERKMPPGQHVVKVVNLATKGHPRIDVDAFMTN
jgi:hypothetical protein